MEQKKYIFYFLVIAVLVWFYFIYFPETQKQEDPNVIGYFQCEATDYLPISIVLKRLDDESFSVLEYKPLPESILSDGQPRHLNDLTEIKISNRQEKPDSFRWNANFLGEYFSEYTLIRKNGNLIYRRKRQDDPNAGDLIFYKCKYGEEGKRLFWEHSQKNYDKEKPKF